MNKMDIQCPFEYSAIWLVSKCVLYFAERHQRRYDRFKHAVVLETSVEINK